MALHSNKRSRAHLRSFINDHCIKPVAQPLEDFPPAAGQRGEDHLRFPSERGLQLAPKLALRPVVAAPALPVLLGHD